MNAIKALPAEEQDAFATEVMVELSLRNQSALTPEQQAIVVERLNEPGSLATPEAVATVLHKY